PAKAPDIHAIGSVFIMKPDASILSAFTPAGHLRASINLGNPILAGRDGDGNPAGVSIDLARAFAERLGVSLELVVLESAGRSVETVAGEKADIGFFAIGPLRAADIAFTDAYIHIEGAYLVREASPIHALEQVDRPGIRVTVGKGSAYDLFLSREIRQAEITRAPTSPAVVETFLRENTEVAAGVRQQLEADASKHPGLRLIPGSFMTIRQAMGVPRSRGEQATAFLSAFVEDMKRSGFILDAMGRHGIEGASVAPGRRA